MLRSCSDWNKVIKLNGPISKQSKQSHVSAGQQVGVVVYVSKGCRVDSRCSDK